MRWLANNWPTIGLATLNHLQLALPAIAAALVIAIPVAWLAHHFRWTRFTLVTLGSLLYAIPSLPLLVVLVGIPAGCIIGTLKVLVDRLKEIGKGEEDAYRNY